MSSYNWGYFVPFFPSLEQAFLHITTIPQEGNCACADWSFSCLKKICSIHGLHLVAMWGQSIAGLEFERCEVTFYHTAISLGRDPRRAQNGHVHHLQVSFLVLGISEDEVGVPYPSLYMTWMDEGTFCCSLPATRAYATMPEGLINPYDSRAIWTVRRRHDAPTPALPLRSISVHICVCDTAFLLLPNPPRKTLVWILRHLLCWICPHCSIWTWTSVWSWG